ncbi:MAG: glycoside hydrolase [Bacteroidales bacterium]|nr:glycoside hydrolase [Bacteroidales bacterium]
MRINLYKSALIILLSGFVISFGSGCSEKPEDNPAEEEPVNIPLVFESGLEGYACYRCVAMVVTHQKTILAFCEGRLNDCADEGDIDLVLKRSTDGGKTWGPLVTLEDDGANPCKNPVPVVLPSGRILLMWLWNYTIPSEKDRTTRDVYLTYSDDDGVTWSESRNITSEVYLDDWGWYGLGPCHGIVKEREPHAGRIIMPSRHEENRSHSHILYSDDNGETWNIGAISPVEGTTESTVVELSDGQLMLNCRNDTDYRIVLISDDGGETFYRNYIDTDLIQPVCQASLLNHSMNPVTGKSNILFSNPADREERVNGTIKLSEDDGKTWTKSYRYSNPYPAFSGYSDMALLDNGDVALLFETGPHYTKPLRWEGIGFLIVRFSDIKPITGGN